MENTRPSIILNRKAGKHYQFSIFVGHRYLQHDGCLRRRLQAAISHSCVPAVKNLEGAVDLSYSVLPGRKVRLPGNDGDEPVKSDGIEGTVDSHSLECDAVDGFPQENKESVQMHSKVRTKVTLVICSYFQMTVIWRRITRVFKSVVRGSVNFCVVELSCI